MALFEEQSISLSRIHAQFNINLLENFDKNAFHKDCDNKGSTLVIMHSNSEPNSFFGGMAASSWNLESEGITDPAGECSWLFKIEVEENMLHFHQWKCIKKDTAIYGSKDCGPVFGGSGGGFGKGAGSYYGGYSYLYSNNRNYEKVNFGLLFKLKNKINCPQKVKRAIMNEKFTSFDLDSCEVFEIKK